MTAIELLHWMFPTRAFALLIVGGSVGISVVISTVLNHQTIKNKLLNTIKYGAIAAAIALWAITARSSAGEVVSFRPALVAFPTWLAFVIGDWAGYIIERLTDWAEWRELRRFAIQIQRGNHEARV